MGRIRTIKPDFPQSESMGRVSRDARLCFIMLWTLADDAGRLRGNSRMLASLLFPYDDDASRHIDNWLEELEREDCIVRFRANNDNFIQIHNWLKHQKIDKPSSSKIPDFREHSRGFVESPRGFVLGMEGNGMEGNGIPPNPLKGEMTDVSEGSRQSPLESGNVGVKMHVAAEKQSSHLFAAEMRQPSVAGKQQTSPQGVERRSPDGDETSTGFERFWASWPSHHRKVGKSDCFRVWKKRKLEQIAEQVIAAVKRAKSSPDWTKQNGEFIPRPKSWLNQTPWETDPAEMAQAETSFTGETVRKRRIPTPEDDMVLFGRVIPA